MSAIADEYEALCAKKCDHHSPCVLPINHLPADRHETAHGCVFYDYRQSGVTED